MEAESASTHSATSAGAREITRGNMGSPTMTLHSPHVQHRIPGPLTFLKPKLEPKTHDCELIGDAAEGYNNRETGSQSDKEDNYFARRDYFQSRPFRIGDGNNSELTNGFADTRGVTMGSHNLEQVLHHVQSVSQHLQPETNMMRTIPNVQSTDQHYSESGHGDVQDSETSKHFVESDIRSRECITPAQSRPVFPNQRPPLYPTYMSQNPVSADAEVMTSVESQRQPTVLVTSPAVPMPHVQGAWEVQRQKTEMSSTSKEVSSDYNNIGFENNLSESQMQSHIHELASSLVSMADNMQMPMTVPSSNSGSMPMGMPSVGQDSQNIMYIVPGMTPDIRKRRELSLKTKVDIINNAEGSGKSQRQIAAQFNICKSQVHNILKRKDEIKETYEISPGSDRKRRFIRTENDEINIMTLEWYHRLKQQNVKCITGKMLQCKAREIAQQLGKTEFKASNGWLESFRKRHKIGPCANIVKPYAPQFDFTHGDLANTGYFRAPSNNPELWRMYHSRPTPDRADIGDNQSGHLSDEEGPSQNLYSYNYNMLQNNNNDDDEDRIDRLDDTYNANEDEIFPYTDTNDGVRYKFSSTCFQIFFLNVISALQERF